MNNKFGDELTLKIDNFKRGLKQAEIYAKAFAKGVKESFNEQVQKSLDSFKFKKPEQEKSDDERTGYQKQIDYVKAQMEEIQDVLNDKKNLEPMDVAKLEADYERLANILDTLNDKQEEFNEELDDTDKKSKKIDLGALFENSISKIKRFTFYLLGARSVFSMFMKYQNIYYQYNENMRYQAELSQNAIALSLAPAFEFLGNVIAYASIAFAKFIELLTGVNVLSKVSTKGIRDYNKALKESRSLLTGIDEITNLTLPSSTGLASQYQALEDFRKKIKEVEEWLDKSGITKFFKEKLIPFVQKVWETLKKIFKFVFEDHWDVFKYIFGAVAIGALAIKIGTSITGLSAVLGATSVVGVSAGSGLAGLAGIFKYLTTLGLITISLAVVVTEGMVLVDMIKKIKELRQQAKDTRLENLNGWPAVFDVVVDRLNKAKKSTDEWNKQNNYIKESVKEVVRLIADGKLSYDEYSPAIQKIIDKLDEVKDKDEIKTEIDILTAIQGKTANDKVMLNYLETGDVNLNLNPKVNWGNDKNTKKLFEGLKSNFTVEGNVKIDTSTAKKKIQTLIDIWEKGGNSGMFVKIATAPLKALLAKLATGTNYVPYDNFPALLHKGEAVVPAKYNPAVGGMGNEYTNSLLETLIMKVDDLASRPNVFEIDGQKFANATYSLYEDTRQRQNYVEGVVR